MVTTSVERSFPAMTFIRNKLRNSMGDEFLNDNLVTYLERDLFENVHNIVIARQFKHMKRRRNGPM